MGSRLKNSSDPGAIEHEVDESPEEIRAHLAESGGVIQLNTRDGTAYMVTEHTLIEPIDE